MDMTIAEQLLYATVKLTCCKNGQDISSGTGFIVQFDFREGELYPVIVTNKHVIENGDEIYFLMHTRDNEGRIGPVKRITVPLENGYLYMHPSEDVDLCCLKIGPAINAHNAKGIGFFFRCLSLEFVPKEEEWQAFDAIEEIIMVGCPSGIFDEYNNVPIVRRGITATSLSRNYNGRKEFMVDIACYPGSSGSPLVIINQGGYFDKRNSHFVAGMSSIKLIGILYAGPQVLNNGEIILSTSPKFSVLTTMHLGYAIKSTALFDLRSEIQNNEFWYDRSIKATPTT